MPVSCYVCLIGPCLEGIILLFYPYWSWAQLGFIACLASQGTPKIKKGAYIYTYTEHWKKAGTLLQYHAPSDSLQSTRQRRSQGHRVIGPLHSQHRRVEPEVTEDVFISRLSTNWQSESCLSPAVGLADKMKTPETFELIWSNVREKELHHLQFLVNSKKDWSTNKGKHCGYSQVDQTCVVNQVAS